MRRLIWLLAIWLGWKVFQEAQRGYADTETPVPDGLAPLSPFPADR
jgi:hypothetical protein